MAKILSGELVVIEYVNGALVNRWAVNAGKTALEYGAGRKATAGFTDILFEKEGSTLPNNRGNIAGEPAQLKLLTDVGFRKQAFGGKDLTVLILENATDIFNSSAVKIGTLPAGTEIGIERGDAGNSNKHLMAVVAYDAKDGLGWRYLNQSSYTSGFLNVQQGFGLKQYNSVRSIETVSSQVQNHDIDWATIATLINDAPLETYLRGLNGSESGATVIKAVNDYFAAIDLDKETLGDAEQFFGNAKQFDYIVSELTKAGLTAQVTKLQDEKAFWETH